MTVSLAAAAGTSQGMRKRAPSSFRVLRQTGLDHRSCQARRIGRSGDESLRHGLGWSQRQWDEAIPRQCLLLIRKGNARQVVRQIRLGPCQPTRRSSTDMSTTPSTHLLECLDIGALCVSKTLCSFRRCFSCKECQSNRDHILPMSPCVLAFRTARLADRGRTPFPPISGGAEYPWLGKMDDWPRERMEPRFVKNRGGIGAVEPELAQHTWTRTTSARC